MAWEHLSINRPHLVYLLLGAFTSLFMLCSSVIKERMYIGEATVATLFGIIVGPHAANLINPSDWGNEDQITLEFCRIVLVVQCFAVGVELPKSYMERHARSVVFLLVPVMTFGWMVTSLFIWGMFHTRLDWLDSLCVAACVTATDPVLASSVVGKGKFARRVPKHLRDLLSAESGCNDGMAFPFIYLAIYLIRYRPDANAVALHWFCYTILYECIFGATYGVLVGYVARRAIRWAHEKDLIDRESFLVFYFVLALFCAGSGSLLGMDDLLIGFACGVGFSNDGWFLEKTEEAHVSNVIDLLINLAFFVYFGTIIPWEQFNSSVLGITPWRLVVVGILVLFFRRIPIMLALKPLIPDIKTWREALFAGHFGPIGVGAIFVAILARAELETEETTPLAELPKEDNEHLNIIQMIWPITTFLVIVSIIVHGSSIAVFTLGKHINTLTISLSYTQANEEGPSWMDRLPRIQSRSKSSMSLRRPSESSIDEKADLSGSGLLPISLPGQFLRRQKEEESSSRASSVRPSVRRRKWDSGRGPGGPISQSAIAPDRRNRDHADVPSSHQQDSDTIAANPSDESQDSSLTKKENRGREGSPEEEIYEEGDQTIIEDEEGNVLEVMDSNGEHGKKRRQHEMEEARRLRKKKDVERGVAQTEHGDPVEQAPGRAVHAAKEGIEHPAKAAEAVQEGVEHPGKSWKDMRHRIARRKTEGDVTEPPKAHKPVQKRGPALAYQFGNTIIVEDEDGEVLKKYDIPAAPKAPKRPGTDRGVSFAEGSRAMQSLRKMGTYVGRPKLQEGSEEIEAGPSGTGATAEGKKKQKQKQDNEDDAQIRFTVTAGGRRMSKADFIREMQRLDPKARAQLVEKSDVPEGVKQEVRKDAKDHDAREKAASHANVPPVVGDEGEAQIHKVESPEERRKGPDGLTLVDSDEEDIPFHSVTEDLSKYNMSDAQKETAAQRRRRLASHQNEPAPPVDTDSEAETADNEKEPAAESRRRLAAQNSSPSPSAHPHTKSRMDEGETAAERKRRLGAMGLLTDDSPDTDSEEEETGDPMETGRGTHRQHSPGRGRSSQKEEVETPRTPGIRFADQEPMAQAPAQGQSGASEGGASGSGSGGHTGHRLRWGANVRPGRK